MNNKFSFVFGGAINKYGVFFLFLINDRSEHIFFMFPFHYQLLDQQLELFE
jgi:hypothetical protein